LFAAPLTLLLWRLTGWSTARVGSRRAGASPSELSRVSALLRVAELARWVAVGYLGCTLAVDVSVPLVVRFGDPAPLVWMLGGLTLLTKLALVGAVLPLVYADL